MARFRVPRLDVASLAAGARESARAAGRFAVRPRFLEEKADGATRVGQWMAALLLPIVIIVSLALLTSFNGVLSSVFGDLGGLAGGQSEIFAFLITAITLGSFILAAWTWFQFVRTAGFGMFSWED